MELLVTLKDIDTIDSIKNLADGIIVGSKFTSGYNFTQDQLNYLSNVCLVNGMSYYIVIDNIISQDELEELERYLEYVSSLDVSGIYYHDLSVFALADKYGLKDKLIYDGKTMLCNSLDVAYYLTKGIGGVVLSNCLSYQELSDILRMNANKCDLQIFGHLRLSYTKRKFLTNYLREIGKENQVQYLNNENMSLVEEQRDYRMPILEDESGTKIYTDYVFQMYKEISELRPFIRRGIIDTLFIDNTKIGNVVRDYKILTDENADILLDSLKANQPDNYSSGFLYEELNITKDEKD